MPTGDTRTMVLGGRSTSAVDTSNLGSLLRDRLMDEVVLFPELSVRLVSYMAWPNDETARNAWIAAHGPCEEAITPNEQHCREFVLIQKHWARAADVLHHHYDLWQGGHQVRRGGASVGKSIHIVAAGAKSPGTGKAKLWEIWSAYKDVAHLVTSAILVSAEANARGLTHLRIQPVKMTMLVPDLVLSVAMTFQRYGLGAKVHGRDEPLFDLAALWRIPENIGLEPIEPPVRKIRNVEKRLLNARRAGHRGKGRSPVKATPVSGDSLDS
jgi:hypothetical protein